VIRGEFGSIMCANSLASVNRKAGVLGIMVFSHRYCDHAACLILLTPGIYLMYGCALIAGCLAAPLLLLSHLGNNRVALAPARLPARLVL